MSGMGGRVESVAGYYTAMRLQERGPNELGSFLFYIPVVTSV